MVALCRRHYMDRASLLLQSGECAADEEAGRANKIEGHTGTSAAGSLVFPVGSSGYGSGGARLLRELHSADRRSQRRSEHFCVVWSLAFGCAGSLRDHVWSAAEREQWLRYRRDCCNPVNRAHLGNALSLW